MKEIKISVLTPSIRPEGMKITQECLAKQTFKDFEWLQEVSIPEFGHDLNAAYNRMLKRAKGELIVSLQDFIKVTPDYLQKFWDAYQADKNVFFTAPVGKVSTSDFSGDIKWDWRAFSDGVDKDGKRDIQWRTWEIDSGCAPKSALFEIGGFDEEIDRFWSCDNLNTAFRAHLAGYKFKNLFINPAIAYDHDASIDHPFRKNFRPGFNKMRMDSFEQGEKIDYLH